MATVLNQSDTPPPPYRRQSVYDRAGSVIANSNFNCPVYCCLGTIHLKTATFVLCLTYLLGLASWWYAVIPKIVDGFYQPVDTDDVITIVVLFLVVVCALVGVSQEHELYFIPIVITQLFGFILVAVFMLFSLFEQIHSPTPYVVVVMETVVWLGLMWTIVWTTSIFLSCAAMFSYQFFANLQRREPITHEQRSKPLNISSRP